MFEKKTWIKNKLKEIEKFIEEGKLIKRSEESNMDKDYLISRYYEVGILTAIANLGELSDLYFKALSFLAIYEQFGYFGELSRFYDN